MRIYQKTQMKSTQLVAKVDSPTRLDVYLSFALGLTRSYIKILIESNLVLLNDQLPKKSGVMIQNGDVLLVTRTENFVQIQPQNIPIDILYEDDHIAVINKQAGLSVHPAGGAKDNTLVNALLFCLKNLSSINGTTRPGIVHRLDKDTTGVMVVAKTNDAHLDLSKKIANRKIKKIYHTLLEGILKQDSGQISAPIVRSSTDRKKMTTALVGSSKARDALSNFLVLKRFFLPDGSMQGYTYTEFDIVTGRTHQIRVHAKHIGHPVVGDKHYGFKKQKIKTESQLLHAYSLTFDHPFTQKPMTFVAPLPASFTKVLDLLEKTTDN